MPLATLFAECSDGCGWVAAVIAVLSFGSFGVPIKGTLQVDVHPLVLQSYKTFVCFATCWLVVFLGESVRFSYYGILSGLFWVPGATCGIFAIRNAGLAIAVGTWSSLNVLTSFVFGIIIFQERVKSLTQTCLAFSFLVLGLLGMAKYAGTRKQELTDVLLTTSGRPIRRPHSVQAPVSMRRGNGGLDDGLVTATTGLTPVEIEPLTAVSDDEAKIMGTIDDDDGSKLHRNRVVLCGGRLSLTKRQMGVLGAVINGAWGGMNLIPLHYAVVREGLSGAGYLISYASGALIVNTAMWLLLFFYYLYQTNGVWIDAFDALPKWHIVKLWKPGLMAGLLYSTGNFSSIIAVTYLGQGTGFSFCQMQLFVSGLWGVLYFREISGVEIVTKWFLSAAVAVGGIVWLSYQHEKNGAIH